MAKATSIFDLAAALAAKPDAAKVKVTLRLKTPTAKVPCRRVQTSANPGTPGGTGGRA